MSRAVRALLIVVLLSLGLVVAPAPVSAAAITVGPGCSLADAFIAAETNTATGGCAAGSETDTITLEANAIYTITTPSHLDDFYGSSALTVRNSTLTIEGNGATIQRASTAGEFRLLWTHLSNVTIKNLTIQGGRVSGGAASGGCVLSERGNLTLEHVTIRDCSGDIGGAGLSFAVFGTLTMTDSTVTGIGGPHDAVRVQSDTAASLTNVTISGNSTRSGLGVVASPSEQPTVQLTNVTISGHSYREAENYGGQLSFVNSILAPGNLLDASNGNVNQGNNVIGVDPKLGPLQNNGGTTLTMVPQPGSPAFNAANSALCPQTDQRGVARPQGAGCEIGAVEVVPTAPVFTSVPANQIYQATGPGGATATYSATAANYTGTSAGVVCAPASGTTFAITTTQVNCRATDSFDSSLTTDASFNVIVQDTTGPTFTSIPATITVEATGADGAAVVYAVVASDLVDGAITADCTLPSGSTFALGTTTVTCTATDSRSNQSTRTFTVTVEDTTAPDFTSVPTAITAEATGPGGAVVTYSVTASDLVDGAVGVTCSPVSGGTFAIGSTTVNCSATDANANQATTSFSVTVRDTTGPVFTSVPGPISLPATSPAGAVVTYSVAASDLVDGAVGVNCNPASGATFPVGTTTVTCTATDTGSNQTTTSFQVTVGSPVVTSLTPNRVSLSARTQTIVVRGSGFVSGATVRVGTTEYAATFVSANELRITIVPREAFALGGWLLLPMTPVQVVNPGGVLSNGTYLFLQR